MNKRYFSALALLTTLAAAGQLVEPVVVERGPHHRIVQTIRREVTPSGQELLKTNAYVELATGLHYEAAPGQWVESQEIIEPAPGGAVAHKGAIKAAWSANLNNAIVLEVLTPDGKRFKSRLLGVAFTEASTGASVIIAEPKDCRGEIIGNQIWYRDALEGPFRADVRFTYTLSGIAQEVLIREAVPSPAEYQLEPAWTRMEIWTEFLEAPTPIKSSTVLKAEPDPQVRLGAVDPDLTDETLDFGLLRFGLGQAFPLESEEADFDREAVPVGKSWVQIPDGQTVRTFLIEKVDYPDVRVQLDALPQAVLPAPGARQALRRPKAAPQREQLLASLRPPTSQPAKDRPMRMAAAWPAEKGFNFDYESLLVDTNNFTFKADTTYFIRANVTLSGTTVLESAVLKFTNGNTASRLKITGPLDCRTDRYRPALFVGKDENKIGQAISGSTGNPSTNYYGYYLDISSNTNVIDVHDVQMRRGFYGVNMSSSSKLILRHAQISSNYAGIVIQSGQVRFRNGLIHDSTYAFGGAGTNNHGEHVTFHRLGYLRSSTSSSYNTFLTNSLVISVTNYVIYTGQNVVSNLNDFGFFQSAGAGRYYLASGTSHRNAGTTNINPDLAQQIKLRTTYPPIVLSTNVTSDTVLSPQAQRDLDLPDIGFHYSPLDFLASGVTLASNVTVLATNGVAIGIDYSQSSWGFIVNSARFLSQGKAEALNRIVRSHTVQEGPTSKPGTRAMFYDTGAAPPPRLSEARFRFTETTQAADDGYFLYTGQRFQALEWTHSRVYAPSLVIDLSGSGTLVCGLTNTLWERGDVQLGSGAGTGSGVTVHLRNNLARRLGSWNFLAGNTNWTVRDNLFDTVGALSDNSSPVQNSYNAYYQTSYGLSGGTSNTNLASLSYELGPLGDYYQPTNSVLVNAGSRAADLAGLYHFTTATNQVKETNSTVDIGIHYVAVNANGQPIDTDGDGNPDHVEDWNGNGSFDSGETDWQSYNSPNGLTGNPGLDVFTPLK